MPRIANLLARWTRKIARSVSAWSGPSAAAGSLPGNDEALIYRLRHWPQIPHSSKTADIYRMLSVMSNRPVNRRWILNNSRLDARAVDHFLRRLIEQDAVVVIDARSYLPEPNAA